jgi:hypothetical protein
MLVVAFIPFMFFYMQSVKLFWRLLAEIQTARSSRSTCPRCRRGWSPPPGG